MFLKAKFKNPVKIDTFLMDRISRSFGLFLILESVSFITPRNNYLSSAFHLVCASLAW